MPEMDGIQATEAITRRSPETAVVVLTMIESDAACSAPSELGPLATWPWEPPGPT